jgi:uroporphyrinogen decarboxylase
MTPVWFMRQAGRYLPRYREIRKKYSVIDVCKTPSLCEQVTLMPVEELGVDAAIMFADIMLPLEGMGVNFKIEENIGPVISAPISGREGVEKLEKFDATKHVPYVLEAITRVRSKLDKTDHALIGFSGAPFTIASYLIEGRPSRDFVKTKKLMFEDPESWKLLMSILSEMVSDYLLAQIRAGVDAVQLFDSWVGALSASDYEKYVAPFVKRIFDKLKDEFPGVPKIHFATNTHHMLRIMKEKAGGDVFGIDWRTPIRFAREVLGDNTAIQGNLDPAVLLPRDNNGFLAKKVQEVLDENGESPGYIFNLGHGMLADTPPENVKFVVEYVHHQNLRK